MSAKTAAKLRTSAEQLRDFKQIATLVSIDVERPEDRETDFAAGAATAHALGMQALARRLHDRAAKGLSP
jgi:hypothetical protein